MLLLFLQLVMSFQTIQTTEVTTTAPPEAGDVVGDYNNGKVRKCVKCYFPLPFDAPRE